MEHLFSLFATLGMDTAQFDEAILRADESGKALSGSLSESMRQAAASMNTTASGMRTAFSALTAAGQSSARALSASWVSAWGSITAAVQGAIDRVRTFLSIKGEQHISVKVEGVTAPSSKGADIGSSTDLSARLQSSDAVLSKVENANWRSAALPQHTSADLTGLSDVLLRALGNVTVQLDGKTVGSLVASGVSDAMGAALKARRYTG